MQHQDEVTAGDGAQGGEIPDSVVRRRYEVRNDHVRDQYREQRIAVWGRFGHDLGADDGVAPGPGLDDDGLAPALGQPGPDQASQYVGGSSRSVRADDAYRL